MLTSVSEQAEANRLRSYLEERIYEFNVTTTTIADGEGIAICLHDEHQTIAAGLSGWTWGGCLMIEFLWVRADVRGRGHGRRLIEAAEQTAKARGCTQALLDTHTFQAPDFYRRLGYEVYARLENYPLGHQKLYLRKSL